MISSVGHMSSTCCALLLLGLEQAVDAIERDAPVVADDAAAAIGIRQAGDDAGLAAGADFGGIGVEHAVIVGLAILGEGFMHLRIGLDAGRLQAGFDHAQPAIRKYRALERLIGLQADDDLVLLVDVARLVRQQRRWRLGVGREHALLPLFLK